MKKLTFSYSLGCVLLVGALSAHAEDIQHGFNVYGKVETLKLGLGKRIHTRKHIDSCRLHQAVVPY